MIQTDHDRQEWIVWNNLSIVTQYCNIFLLGIPTSKLYMYNRTVDCAARNIILLCNLFSSQKEAVVQSCQSYHIISINRRFDEDQPLVNHFVNHVFIEYYYYDFQFSSLSTATEFESFYHLKIKFQCPQISQWKGCLCSANGRLFFLGVSVQVLPNLYTPPGASFFIFTACFKWAVPYYLLNPAIR